MKFVRLFTTAITDVDTVVTSFDISLRNVVFTQFSKKPRSCSSPLST